MNGQFKRNNQAAPFTVYEADTMRTIIATILAVITATILVSYDNQSHATITTTEHAISNVQETKTVLLPSKVEQQAPIENAVRATQEASGGSCDGEISKYTSWDQNVAQAVMMAESSNNAHNIGDTKLQYVVDGISYGASYGCFQIRYLPGRPSPDSLLDAAFNVKYANDMYLGQGWKPWSAYTTGKYKQYLR